MDNPFEYPEDRSEIYGESNEEEASFYFTLMDFQALVKRYGVEFIMNRLDENTFVALGAWWLDDDEEDLIDWRNTDEA